MKQTTYSQRARQDLLNITTYTIETWGIAQAIRYLDSLESACERLSLTPNIGRDCSRLAFGLRRLEHGKHVIFYTLKVTSLRVERILHQSQLPLGNDFSQ